jgi:malonyl-CoA O-methyltransferase
MLAELRGKSRLLRPLRPVCGDLDRLPLADASVDMVFANLSTYWSTSPDSLYAEIRRVLKAGGMLLFSTLGPGTFSQLRAAWAAADDGVEVPWFPDILEVGDALARAGFSEPAMDTETITLEYRGVDALMTELESTGTSLLVRGWEKWRGQVDSLAGSWAPAGADGRLPLTYEIIYGAAFEPPESAPRKPGDGDILRISVDSLLK